MSQFLNSLLNSYFTYLVAIIFRILLIGVLVLILSEKLFAQEAKPIHRTTPPKNSRERQKALLNVPVQKESSTDRKLRQTYAEGIIAKKLPKNKAAKSLVKPVRAITKKPLAKEITTPVLASQKKPFEGASYEGDYVAPKAKTNPQSRYSGTIAIRELKKKERKIQRIEDDRARYTGNLSIATIRKKQRRSEQVRKQMSTFSGDIVVLNTPAVMRKRAKKISSFKGEVLIKQKPARDKYKTINYSSPLRNRTPANYNRSKLKAGAKLKKSELPNYQKNPPKKISYDAREAEFWRTGGSLKDQGFRVPERQKPKPVKKKKAKSTGDDQEKLPPLEKGDE
ncbi:MAG: hypothetical protein NZ551_10540 [Microscillaceae bacterium]|nr:hypothetical protein [Microscillaceae bacterium]MDW8461636.1 hypothetical protein [Cytophagales bacterium]